ncbi:glycerophosphodiester phosphodiesterase [Infirmifilum lucidum]|uniref:Glycerophosphodiester phosphodiesterase n=1 Tax=Infirmifilum lucidum TaxID=2776706 RepID=A0A7L9FIG7_9CREN|nr:glycerophosphodiester phosphodiesterase [Infirmifilum lucidum]QOJ78716.1 glycerophosphodiester phosphodiesterase [Infirmifilum lucidum]
MHHRPIIVAHKANRKSLLLKYLRVGVEVVEFDVTRDGNGELVVKHGMETGVRGLRGLVMDYGYLLIEGRDPLFRPSTLEEHLSLVGSKCGVWLDLKTRGIEVESVALARKFGVRDVIVSSGFHNTIRRAKEVDGSVTAILGNVQYRPANPVKEVELASADGISVHYYFVDRELVEELHSVGFKVAVWTVNNPAKASELVELGVDYLITDAPEKLRLIAAKAGALAGQG